MLRKVAISGAVVAAGAGAWLWHKVGHHHKDGIREFYRASYNRPPADWKHAVFKPSLDYPTKPPQSDVYPWETIDYEKKPVEYLQAVLDYCFEGNVEHDFVVQKNPVRKWFHAPWMTQTPFGREPLHGLTFERPASREYLGEGQKKVCQTWAVGMYNEPGGYMIGQVWKEKYKPDTKPGNQPVKFSNATVSFKLLFTQADKKELPFLEGSPEWQATIAKMPFDPKQGGGPSEERTEPKNLRLLQVDIAVRDHRADKTTGWLFGTFMYHNSVENSVPWKRLMPVCLMWGNDPRLNQKLYDKGERPKQSWVNPDAIKALQIPRSKRPYLGWLERANGPVDNYISSCISCHATANSPRLNMTYEVTDKEHRKQLFFRNVGAGEPFGFVGDPLDYSLQLMVGVDNNDDWQKRWSSFFYFKRRGAAPPLSSYPQHKLSARGIVLSDYSNKEKEEVVL
eukprot:m.29564 g.29564  ORF g.29564 m.29564 type:complete len:452 (+) comp31187_c0_seq1:197-1552(+)